MRTVYPNSFYDLFGQKRASKVAILGLVFSRLMKDFASIIWPLWLKLKGLLRIFYLPFSPDTLFYAEH